jgi:hypothetical protein
LRPRKAIEPLRECDTRAGTSCNIHHLLSFSQKETMSTLIKLSVFFVAASFILAFLTPYGFVSVIASLIFSGFIVWTEKYSEEQFKQQSKEFQALVGRFEKLREVVDTIRITKSLGK